MLCVILRSRALRVVCQLIKDTGRRLSLELQLESVVATRVNRVMLVSLCAETIKPVFEGDKYIDYRLYMLYIACAAGGSGEDRR